ncbi:hypothetical protein PBI_OMNICRON_57 [Mycobacterium phage Omnicron]|uniref:Uncharacterized protein n=1 Tax=Mycobacterium phage Omnicron TaxID=1541819 RepID=A0A088FQ74_9CAUD|nr:hypothetical protein PBI_OMNICRON_57 [Mycobacterium phage Omnicron]AIM50390.1 hypothetical protein PBI_OMNICRON_57 [Mycobacterium phage Omnicron]
MSKEFVMVGRVPLDHHQEVVVGVLPKTGDVQTYINSNLRTTTNRQMPISLATANEWAELLQKAAKSAEAIRAAHEQYQVAIAAVVGSDL